jgi:Bacterial PH domain
MQYKASLDLKSKIITVFVGFLLVGINAIDFKLISRTQEAVTWWVLISVNIMVLSLLAFCYLFRPLGYIVDQTGITVKRPIHDFKLNREEIKDAIIPTKESMKWTIRTFGNGGVFGYYGSFWNRGYRTMTWYATRTSHYLMIITIDGKKIVLTPDDPGMANEVKKLVG